MLPIQNLNGYDRPWAGGAGKNMANVTIASGTAAGITTTNNGDGSVTFTGTSTSTVVRYVATGINLKAGVAYALSGRPAGDDIPSNVWVALYPSTGSTAIEGTDDRGSGSTYTPEADEAVRVGVRMPSGFSPNGMTVFPMLRLASTSAEYAPYENVCPIYGFTDATAHVSPNSDLSDPTNYEVLFGQTVYGGTLDFVTGVLTATWKYRTLTGTESYSMSDTTYLISISRSDYNSEAKNSGQIISDRFAYTSNITGWNFGRVTISSNGIIQFTNANQYYTDADSFKSWVAAQYAAGTPVQLCYELATPQTIQLDPQAITTLQGQNNIWVTTTTNEP